MNQNEDEPDPSPESCMGPALACFATGCFISETGASAGCLPLALFGAAMIVVGSLLARREDER